MGLDLALEWGVIAFVADYIPFIGPLIATVSDRGGLLQFGSWQSVVTNFAVLQVIQFLIVSYLEPRWAGRPVGLALPGAGRGVPRRLPVGHTRRFIGVPTLIAALTLCEQFEGSRWVADCSRGGAG